MDELLAKPDKTLVEHSLEVFALGKQLAERLNLSNDIKKRALLACLFHDLGKATHSFQEHIRGLSNRAYPHALASLPYILVAELELMGSPLIASAAVLSHHSPLSPWLFIGWNSPKLLPELKQVLKSILEKAPEFALEPNGIIENAAKLGNPSELLHGVSFMSKFKNLPREKFASVMTILHLADWMASSGKTNLSSLFLVNGTTRIEKFIKTRNFKLRDFQRRLFRASDEKEIRLRAPTGSGKTEALLLWASDARRILYLLPTQATCNAMWKRLIKIYGFESVGISHGRAKYVLYKQWQKDTHTDEEPPLDYRLFATVFAKPVVVATLDQFLMAFMNGKHWEEKQTLVNEAAVIIDEVHAYEPYTLGLLKEALRLENYKKLALASATFPDLLLDMFGKNRLILADDFFWEQKRYKINTLEDTPIEEVMPDAIALARKGKRVLVIVNTVDKAQELFKTLSAHWRKTLLLHSRFVYRDRTAIEDKIKSAEPGTILVSTQIIEVSLDISYDILFTELAPLDALIQRMGRVNRQGEKSPVNVTICNWVDKNTYKMYGEELLQLTSSILKDSPHIPKERDFIKMTNELYHNFAKTDYFKGNFEEGQKNFKELRDTLGTFTVDLGDEEFRKRFITRKGIYSIDVIPSLFVEEALTLVENNKRWKLIELVVPVHGYWAKMYPEHIIPHTAIGYPILNMDYDENLGVIRPDHEKIEIL